MFAEQLFNGSVEVSATHLWPGTGDLLGAGC
jgi:hypothetical protein